MFATSIIETIRIDYNVVHLLYCVSCASQTMQSVRYSSASTYGARCPLKFNCMIMDRNFVAGGRQRAED